MSSRRLAIVCDISDTADVDREGADIALHLCADIAVHLISDLEIPDPETMGNTFDALAEAGLLERNLATRLKKAVGFRSIAVHNSVAIDWKIVYSNRQNQSG